MRIGYIGAGSMASALARGIGVPGVVFDVDASRARSLAEEIGGEVATSNADLAEGVDLVILCHKPALTGEVAGEVGGRARAVASIVAATSTKRLEEAYGQVPVYRFIPNIPAEVRQGLLCYSPGARAGEGPEDEVIALFGRAGKIVPLEEPLIEPATAIMSCGPAFVALVVEAMAGAGARHGLDGRLAVELVVGTMAGSAAYLEANGLDPAELRRRVATPGGLTERGLEVLERGGVGRAFDDAVDLVVEATAA